MSLKSCCLHIHLRKQRFSQPPLLLQAQKEAAAAAAAAAEEEEEEEEEEEAVSEEDHDNRNVMKGHKRKLMLSSSSSMAHPSKVSPSHPWSCFKRLLRKQFLPTSLTDNSDTAPLLPNKLPHKLVQLKEIDANIQEDMHKSAFASRFKEGAKMDAKIKSSNQGCLVKAEFSKKLHKRNKKRAICLSRENKPFIKLFNKIPQEGSELLLASNTRKSVM